LLVWRLTLYQKIGGIALFVCKLPKIKVLEQKRGSLLTLPTILPGVHIGKNVVIGAGSVVTKDIPDDTIAVGNPSKVIKDNK